MRRREFLITNLIMFVSQLFGSSLWAGKKFDFWVWLHPDCNLSTKDWQERFLQLQKSGVNNILIQVYTGKHALFNNDLYALQTCDILKTILPVAGDLGLKVHAWMWTLINPSPTLKEQHADWYVINKLGQSTVTDPPYVGYYNWLCPSKPAVRQYLLKVVDSLLQYRELAGIHFDYIRFPDVILPPGIQPKYHLKQVSEEPQFDYCYCSDCRSLFKEQQGHDPLTITTSEEQQAWEDFRQKQITNLVHLLSKPVKEQGKITSAAVFATPQLARKFVRQNWPEWDLNLIFPMIYHEYYNQPLSWIFEATRQGVQAIGQNKQLISGVFLGQIPPENLNRAIALAKKAGAQGVSFFSYNHLIQNQQYLNILQHLK